MFRIKKATSTEVDRAVEQCSGLNLRLALLHPRRGLQVSELPRGFVRDLSHSQLGTGRKFFEAAISAFEGWKQFDLGWVRIANPGALIHVGQIVAVDVQALGLRSLNLSQVVNVTRDADAFGFIYKTTPHHAEEGEERFFLTFDPDSENVQYELEAVSRPQHWLPRLGYPVTRMFQHKFARDSHRRMRHAASKPSASGW